MFESNELEALIIADRIQWILDNIGLPEEE
jgi:hypothetical protein